MSVRTESRPSRIPSLADKEKGAALGAARKRSITMTSNVARPNFLTSDARRSSIAHGAERQQQSPLKATRRFSAMMIRRPSKSSSTSSSTTTASDRTGNVEPQPPPGMSRRQSITRATASSLAKVVPSSLHRRNSMNSEMLLPTVAKSNGAPLANTSNNANHRWSPLVDMLRPSTSAPRRRKQSMTTTAAAAGPVASVESKLAILANKERRTCLPPPAAAVQQLSPAAPPSSKACDKQQQQQQQQPPRSVSNTPEAHPPAPAPRKRSVQDSSDISTNSLESRRSSICSLRNNGSSNNNSNAANCQHPLTPVTRRCAACPAHSQKNLSRSSSMYDVAASSSRRLSKVPGIESSSVANENDHSPPHTPIPSIRRTSVATPDSSSGDDATLLPWATAAATTAATLTAASSCNNTKLLSASSSTKAAATAAAAAIVSAAAAAAAAATSSNNGASGNLSKEWQQLMRQCIDHAQRLELFAQGFVPSEQQEQQQQQNSAASNKQLAVSKKNSPQLKELQALLQTQRSMLDQILNGSPTIKQDPLLSPPPSPTQQVAPTKSGTKQSSSSSTTTANANANAAAAAPSVSSSSTSSSSSSWLEDNVLKFRWNVSQLVGGGVGTGQIIGCDAGPDGQPSTVTIAGIGVTTEPSLLPSHLQHSALDGVYYQHYVLHIEQQQREEKFTLLSSKHWVPDDQVKKCEFTCDSHSCDTEFAWYARRHHCRRCGHVFCNVHSSNRLALFDNQTARAEWSRVCDTCFYELIGPSLAD
ncbi:hypothetical protein VTP01DRAFT_6182 [Rhizomucor pusillus]|uniref:uncharacterized protein n=1 Tax=Rhizomucor pusillus TaxID=4840 RepID=UPI0037435247